MIRYYTVNYDTPRGGDYEETFRTYYDAVKFYDSLHSAVYKSLKAYDDKTGDVLITNEKKEDDQ
jgi:hypothetical protein